jgi:hypothetical protein
MNPRIRDACYSTSAHSGASIEYAEGVLLGLVAALMDCHPSTAGSFDKSWAIVKAHLPADYRKKCVPEPWRND